MNADKNYEDLVDIVSTKGTLRKDRTGVGTLSVFGLQQHYDISNSFPLITSKRVYWKGVVEELLWMLKGSTNAAHLQEKNVHIWDGNSTREFLDSLNLEYPTGHLGPVYGHQWRHFNAQYIDADTDYTNNGFDQISEVLRLLRNDPTSRRIIISAWNPAQNHQMALPACHTLAQFYVDGDKLSCQLYQRSADIGLGVPFNIASYSLLTYILAKMTGLVPHEFVHTIGDAHIYTNHIEQLKMQMNNATFSSPTLNVKVKKEKIEDYTLDDFELIGYKFSKGEAMKMAV
jgi:thymidylate synthase